MAIIMEVVGDLQLSNWGFTLGWLEGTGFVRRSDAKTFGLPEKLGVIQQGSKQGPSARFTIIKADFPEYLGTPAGDGIACSM
jgi:hypothetical protein